MSLARRRRRISVVFPQEVKDLQGAFVNFDRNLALSFWQNFGIIIKENEYEESEDAYVF